MRLREHAALPGHREDHAQLGLAVGEARLGRRRETHRLDQQVGGAIHEARSTGRRGSGRTAAATRPRARSTRRGAIAMVLGTSSPTTTWRKVIRRNEAAIATVCAPPVPNRPIHANQGSSRCANAGSPTHPSAKRRQRDAELARGDHGVEVPQDLARARRRAARPRCTSSSMRVTRTLTIANSAATKNALIATAASATTTRTRSISEEYRRPLRIVKRAPSQEPAQARDDFVGRLEVGRDRTRRPCRDARRASARRSRRRPAAPVRTSALRAGRRTRLARRARSAAGRPARAQRNRIQEVPSRISHALRTHGSSAGSRIRIDPRRAAPSRRAWTARCTLRSGRRRRICAASRSSASKSEPDGRTSKRCTASDDRPAARAARALVAEPRREPPLQVVGLADVEQLAVEVVEAVGPGTGGSAWRSSREKA